MRLKDTELAVYVRDHRGVTPTELSEMLDVSERTVRTYVRQANDAMDPFAQIVLKRRSYTLDCTDEPAFADWLSRDREKWGPVVSALPTNSRERVAYIIDDLLSRNDWITKDELAEMLFVSATTVSHDLALAEKAIDAYGLTIERRPRYGIRVVGGEMARRLCIASVVPGGLLGDEAPDGADRRELLKSVSACIDDVVRRDGFSVSTIAHRNLLVHIAVAVLRIREGNYVPMDGDDLKSMEQTREYAIAMDIARELETTLDVTLPAEEVAYIAIHLASKQMISKNPDAQGFVISDEVWDVVTDMLDLVDRSFHYDFRENLELRMNLARHIVPLSYRLTYNMNLKNPLLNEVRERYPLAWSMAVESSAALAHAYGRTPSDDEVGYIAMSFALALEREQTQAEGKNILIVCASGAGTAKLLEHLYEREFGEWLSSVTTCDAAHVGDVDLTHIDYVFTTVPLDLKIPRPVREVSAFLDEAEKCDVRAVLSSQDTSEKVLPFFDRRLFFSHVPATTREEALEWLCARRIEYGGAGKGFRDLVFKREAVMQTTYGNNVAMPHPLEPVSDATVVTVGIMDKPVPWGDNHEVQAVFLLSVARDGGPGRDFYDALATLMVDEAAVARLVRERSWDTLCELLGAAE